MNGIHAEFSTQTIRSSCKVLSEMIKSSVLSSYSYPQKSLSCQTNFNFNKNERYFTREMDKFETDIRLNDATI